MTVVYIDSLFLLNFIVDYLLLLATAKLAGEVICRPRLALGAAVGALYASAVFFPGMGFLTHPLCKLSAAIVMLLAGLGGSRRLLRVTLVFLGLSCAFGGGIFAIGLLGGRGLTLRNGILYSAMDLKIILLSAAVCYVALTLVFSRTAKHSRRELIPAVLSLGEKGWHSRHWSTRETRWPIRSQDVRLWWLRGQNWAPFFRKRWANWH